MLVTLAALAWASLPFAAFGQPRPQISEAQLVASMENGYARFVFTFADEAKAEVQLSNNVLVVRFAKPVRVNVDSIQQLKEIVQAARADPDGAAVRVAFSQKVSVNVMEAGEKLFVDILPESWAGLPPSLPQEVVDNLARRARDAERKARAEQEKPRIWQPVRLRFAEAPGFARFAFQLSEPVPVIATQDGQELKITFAAPVKIDFGDAQASLPPSVVSLQADYADGVANVRVVLAPNASQRHFREQSAFIVDVTPPPATKPDPVQGVVPESETQAEVSPQPEPAPKAEPTPQVAQKAKQQVVSPPAPAVVEAPELNLLKRQVEQAPAQGQLTAAVVTSVSQTRTGVQIGFAFGEPVTAAVFRRGDRIWMVFDTARHIEIAELVADRTRSFSDVSVAEIPGAKVVKLKLKGGWITSAETDGYNWTVHFGDAVISPSKPLIVRRMSEETGAQVTVPFDDASAGKVHRIDDPEIGDDIRVVTAAQPLRGVLRAQDFLEFKLLPSAHGIALLPLADDLTVMLRADYVAIGRPKGLALSATERAPDAANTRPERTVSSPLDAASWEAERNRRFREREAEILEVTASVLPAQRHDSRMMLATFYLAHGLAAEAKGTLDTIKREDSKTPVSGRFHLLRGLSELMLGRPAKALEDLTNSELKDSQDAALLRAVVYAELSAWTEARENLRAGAAGQKLLPIDLQRRVLFASLRAAIEVRDFSEAGRLINDLDATEVPDEYAGLFALLSGRVAEGLGRFDRAEQFYDTAAKSNNGPASAEAHYKQVELKFRRGEYSRAKAIDRLEALAFFWRGDRIELESNRLLARLYVEEARYRDAFRLLDAALLAQPNAPVTRTFQNEMATVFEDLFLSGKADALPAVDALALYYDFSKLTPVGRRGDELIRRLSERLVSVDLLDQASELLQHQVEFRLTGAAKAQVATRLAIVHLMNRKPQRAVAILQATRLADLPQDIREQRLLLESRALMHSNRFDPALDILTSLRGPEVERQRSDILWAAKRWRQAGEQIEKYLGERWKDEEPLDEVERHDILRAGLAYALAGETLGLARLKEKYGPRLSGAPEKAAFDQIGENPNPRAIGAATKLLANLDSLSVFLKMYSARFPAPSNTPRADQLSNR